jgi:hypothetical protein
MNRVISPKLQVHIKGERSSLFCPSATNKEEKSIVTRQPMCYQVSKLQKKFFVTDTTAN